MIYITKKLLIYFTCKTPTYSLFGNKSDNWPLSLFCHLESFFSLLIWHYNCNLDILNTRYFLVSSWERGVSPKKLTWNVHWPIVLAFPETNWMKFLLLGSAKSLLHSKANLHSLLLLYFTWFYNWFYWGSYKTGPQFQSIPCQNVVLVTKECMLLTNWLIQNNVLSNTRTIGIFISKGFKVSVVLKSSLLLKSAFKTFNKFTAQIYI